MCRPGYVLSRLECHEGKLKIHIKEIKNIMYVVYKGEEMRSFSEGFFSRKKIKVGFI